MIDAGVGKRILEILDKLYFDDTIISLALSLLKILIINPDVATQMIRDGAAETLTHILKENTKKESIIRLCSQTLCKSIVNTEASEIAGTQGVIDILCEIAKQGNNCYKAPLMIDIMKVFQNMCTIEMNSQRIARYAAVPLLRGMESLKINAIFMLCTFIMFFVFFVINLCQFMFPIFCFQQECVWDIDRKSSSIRHSLSSYR